MAFLPKMFQFFIIFGFFLKYSIQNYVSNACICFFLKKKKYKNLQSYVAFVCFPFLTWSHTCGTGLSCKVHG